MNTQKQIFFPSSPHSTKTTTIDANSPKGEFELFKAKNSCEDFSKDKNEIFNILAPHFDRLRQKDEVLHSLVNEANWYYEEYKKKNCEVEEETKKIENKKEKLKFVYHSLYQFKRNLIKKEK